MSGSCGGPASSSGARPEVRPCGQDVGAGEAAVRGLGPAGDQCFASETHSKVIFDSGFMSCCFKNTKP